MRAQQSVSELLDQVHVRCEKEIGYECPTNLHRTLIKVIYSRFNPNRIILREYK
jgi:hypothetical protein